jgi:hypothetical protein
MIVLSAGAFGNRSNLNVQSEVPNAPADLSRYILCNKNSKQTDSKFNNLKSFEPKSTARLELLGWEFYPSLAPDVPHGL